MDSILSTLPLEDATERSAAAAIFAANQARKAAALAKSAALAAEAADKQREALFTLTAATEAIVNAKNLVGLAERAVEVMDPKACAKVAGAKAAVAASEEMMAAAKKAKDDADVAAAAAGNSRFANRIRKRFWTLENNPLSQEDSGNRRNRNAAGGGALVTRRGRGSSFGPSSRGGRGQGSSYGWSWHINARNGETITVNLWN